MSTCHMYAYIYRERETKRVCEYCVLHSVCIVVYIYTGLYMTVCVCVELLRELQLLILASTSRETDLCPNHGKIGGLV